MIIGFVGNIGDGKTYGAVREIYKFYLKLGYTIYSNTWIDDSRMKYIPLDINFLLDIVEKGYKPAKKSLFFIDEIATQGLDSRQSMSKMARILSYFLSQTRKLSEGESGLIFVFTTQYLHMIDKRLKSFMDIGIETEKHIIKGKKYFVQEWNYFKGKHSYKRCRVVPCEKYIYTLYDTSKVITVAKNRYNEVEAEL